MQRCWFCQLRPGRTVEHLISEAWMAREMPSEGPYLYEFERNEHGRGDAAKPYFHPRPEIEVAGFCADCNGGWMDKLDKRIEPWLTTAIRGQRRVMQPDFAADLAQWICKVAIVADTMQREAALSQDQRDYLYEHREPPPGWRIWLGLGEPRDGHRALVAPITLVRPTGRGYMFTIALDVFLAQALVLPNVELGSIHPFEPDVVRPLWPLPDIPKLAWPDGTRRVTDVDLETFAWWAAGSPVGPEGPPP